MQVITHAITIDAPRSKVYDAITTTDGLEGWYAQHVEGTPQAGGELTFSFDKHEGPFTWKVTKADQDSVRWECVAGPGDAAGTVATFRLADRPDGRTAVDFDHEGFAETGEKLRVCNTLWGGLLTHLRQYVETADRAPALA